MRFFFFFLFFSFSYLVLVQSFYYMDTIPGLYALSKIGLPVLGCFSAIFFFREKRFLLFWFFCFVYMIVAILSVFRSSVVFGQGLFFGLLSQVKLANIWTFFLVFSWLSVMGVKEPVFEKLVMVVGFVTIVFYLLLYLWVSDEYLEIYNQFTSSSSSKGVRWMLPYHHALFAFFIGVIALLKAPSKSKILVYLIYISLFLYYMIVYYQQKMLLFSVVLTCFFYILLKLDNRVRFLFAFLAFAATIPFVYVYFDFILELLSFRVDSLGIRGATISAILLDVDHFGKVIFGVGGLSAYSGMSFQDLFGVNFWLSDVGYVGILYEYGVFGLVCLSCFWIYVLSMILQYCGSAGAVPSAAGAYLVCMFFQSPLVPELVYGVGEITFFLAVIFYYGGQNYRRTR